MKKALGVGRTKAAAKGPEVHRKYLQAGRAPLAIAVAVALGTAGAASQTVWAQAAPGTAAGTAPGIAAGGPTRTVYLYTGAGQSEAKVGAWGNGAAAKATDMDYEGADSLKVTTRNLNEGVRFDVAEPLDIGPYAANGLVRLRVRFTSPFGGGGFPGGGNPGGGFGGGGFPGGGNPGGQFPGGGFPGGGGDGGGFPGGGFPDGGDDGGGFEGGGFEGAPLFSPSLARVTAAGAAGAGSPRVLGKVQTQAHAQFGGGQGGQGGFPGGGFPGGQGGGFPGGGAQGGNPGGGFPGGGFPGGGFPGGGFPGGGEGGMGGMMMPPPQRTPIERFQVTMMLERGTMTGGIDFSMRRVQADDAGWRLLTLPLRNMRATPNASGRVRRVIVTSDKEDTWYLGQIALAQDSREIAVSLRQQSDPVGAQAAEITVAPGPITLVADVEAGASDVAVEWNFDADNVGAPMLTPPGMAPGMGMPPGMGGPGMGTGMPPGMGQPGMGQPGMGQPGMGQPGMQPGMGGPGMPPGMGGAGENGMAPGMVGPRIDARGLVGKFEYPNEEQNYRVEVTVRDRAGKKTAATASILVKVRG